MLMLPAPYPDEIDCSLISRFSDRVALPTNEMLLEVLFNGSIRVVPGLQGNLGILFSKIPNWIQYTLDDFLQNLLPIYHIFYPSERFKQIREALIDADTASALIYTGLVGNGIPSHRYMKFCNRCVDDDRRRFGETYWHRSHQFHGVHYCWKHKIPLSESAIPTTGLREFISAEKALTDTEIPSHTGNIEKIDDVSKAIRFACDVHFLLNNNSNEIIDIFKRYHKALFSNSLCTYIGSIRAKQLKKAFNSFYSDDYLKLLGSSLEDTHQRNWIAKIANIGEIQHPVRHLLLIQMLGLTIQEFVNLDTAITPFGLPPYPCLNDPVCEYHGQLAIDEVYIGMSRRARRAPIGTFICPYCGFTYKRVGPDDSIGDRYVGKVVEYGALWRTRLLSYSSSNLSKSEIAQKLGIHIETLNRYLRLLADNPDFEQVDYQAYIDNQKSLWREVLSIYPELGVAELIQKFPKLYWFLYGHDVSWLMLHSPDNRYAESNPRIDWNKRDLRCSQKVSELATLMYKQDPPVQVSTNALGIQLGWSDGRIHKDLEFMPRTYKAISEIIESDEDFAIRRIHLVAHQLLERREAISRANFIRAAGLSRAIQTERVMSEVNKVCTELNNGELLK